MKDIPMLLFAQLVIAGGISAATANAFAQNRITIDATSAVPAPQPVEAALGASRNPDGHTLGVNSQYLTLDGKPWLPVMGEFHFSRYPEAEWETEILKMKAAGVQIISTYVIWIHHEQIEDVFDWKGQRDLRRFTRLCAKHGMYVYPRIGPWAHAEVRNGGLPDWVLKNGPVRQNDPVYLREVQTFYAAIAQQLQGLLWKDGGPVIGIQIENEYRGSEPGHGVEHIRTLKKMAVEDGFDVPLYTVTGWDGAAIPLDAALPVFGGYPDAPWDGSPKAEPPNEVYAFRFKNRSAGSMGALGGRGQSNAASYKGTPFLTAEVGDGIEDTYFRRPVVSADDIAAIVPVMLGSGVNMLGYYMFHGGRNPDGGDITLQESQRTGYPTDVPEKSYDFQAPLGEFGQQRESLQKLKLVHYFLNDFGSQLAPMAVRMPSKVPVDPADGSVPRVSARTAGKQGFIFFNNHVRSLAMPARPAFQIELHLPDSTVMVPEKPIRLPADAYGVWPVNLPLPGTTLRYSTAQLFKRVESHGEAYYFFFAIPGISPEFVLDPAAQVLSVSREVTKISGTAGLHLHLPASLTSDIHLDNGVHLLLLPAPLAETVWRGDDSSILLSTDASAFCDGQHCTIQSTGDAHISFGVFGTTAVPVGKDGTVAPRSVSNPLFRGYEADLLPVNLPVQVTLLKAAEPPPPVETGPEVSWRSKAIAMVPDDASFKAAAVWSIDLPAVPASPQVSDAFLEIAYQGDIARIVKDGHLLDDNFWNGLPISAGMKELRTDWTHAAKVQLRVLPVDRHFPMYIQNADQLHFKPAGAFLADLISVKLVPQYQLQFQLTADH